MSLLTQLCIKKLIGTLIFYEKFIQFSPDVRVLCQRSKKLFFAFRTKYNFMNDTANKADVILSIGALADKIRNSSVLVTKSNSKNTLELFKVCR